MPENSNQLDDNAEHYMQSNIVTRSTEAEAKNKLHNQSTAVNYDEAEQQFLNLLEMEDLDKKLAAQPGIAGDFETALNTALTDAYVRDLVLMQHTCFYNACFIGSTG